MLLFYGFWALRFSGCCQVWGWFEMLAWSVGDVMVPKQLSKNGFSLSHNTTRTCLKTLEKSIEK